MHSVYHIIAGSLLRLFFMFIIILFYLAICVTTRTFFKFSTFTGLVWLELQRLNVATVITIIQFY